MIGLIIDYSDSKTQAGFEGRVRQVLDRLGKENVSFLEQQGYRISVLSQEIAKHDPRLAGDYANCDIGKKQITVSASSKAPEGMPKFLSPYFEDFEMTLAHELMHPVLWKAKFRSARATSEYLHHIKEAQTRAAHIAPDEMREVTAAFSLQIHPHDIEADDPDDYSQRLDAMGRLQNLSTPDPKRELALLIGTFCDKRFYKQQGYDLKDIPAEIAANLYSLFQKYDEKDVRAIAREFLERADAQIAGALGAQSVAAVSR